MDVDLKLHLLTLLQISLLQIKVGIKYNTYLKVINGASLLSISLQFFVKLQLPIVSGLNGELGGGARRLVETLAQNKGLVVRDG